MSGNRLFSERRLWDIIEGLRGVVNQEIGSLAEDIVLTVDETQYCAEISKKYSFTPLKLAEGEPEYAEKPRESERDAFDPAFRTPYRQKVYEFRFEIGYEGSKGLWGFEPNQGYVGGNKPQAEVRDRSCLVS